MMQVKKYIAPSFAEALIQAKNELGTDALIVESKKLKVGGIMGLFRKELVELTMAVEKSARTPAGKPYAAAGYAAAATTGPLAGADLGEPSPALVGMKPKGGALRSVPKPADSQPELAGPLPSNGAEPTVIQPAALTMLEREVASLRTAIARMIEHNGAAPAPQLQGYGRQVYEGLLAAGVDEAAALDIGQRVGKDGEDGEEILRRELDRLMGPVAPIAIQPGRRTVVALVGPTGVGKTTTLAKLAARFTLERGLKVALISADTYRIAAIEQLRTYAEILGLPLYPVDTPAQVAHAMKETADCDLVLVDTGGRNHKDAQKMQELREMLAVLRPDEVHLVFSLTANPQDAFEAMNYYLPLGVNRLSFTKLDEATAPGLILNVRMRCEHPLGYVTNGQSVPDDITPADQADFTRILLGA